MSLKRITALICSILLLASVFTSCKKNSGPVDLTGDNSANISDASTGNQGEDAQTSNGSDAFDPTSVPDVPSSTPSGEVVVVDSYPDYSDVKIVNVESARSKSGIKTGYFSADETYFYYVDNDSENIYKAKIDGSDKPVKLCDDKVTSVDINSDGKLDFTTNMEEGMDSNFFTMNKDGSGRVDNHELLLDFFGPTSYKKDGKTYAKLGMNENFDIDGIYVYDSKKSEADATLVKAGIIDSFCVVDNYLVMCIGNLDGYALYRSDLDGENMVKLFTAQASKISVVNDTVYFINLSDDGYIHQVSVDAIKSAK